VVTLDYPLKGTKYVNASWVLRDEEMKLIVAQSHMSNTVHHFLQMIHENKVNIVVALADGESKFLPGNNNRNIKSHRH
jgi:protein tyrosine phosphatase